VTDAVLGAGGIGGLIATMLSAGGESVIAVVRPETIAEQPKIFTLERSGAPELSGPVRSVTSLTKDDAVGALWITTKATQLQEALASVKSTRPRAVVPLLNGIDHIAELKKTFGSDAVIPATIAVEAEKLAPGRFRQASPFANLVIAERGRAALAKDVAVLERFGVDVRFDPDDVTLLWRKLSFLAPFALVTSASRQPIGFVRDDPAWRERYSQAVREVVSVARAAGAKLDDKAQQAFIDRAPAGMTSSMLKDLNAGRKPELDAIAGAVTRAAEQHAIAVPTVRDLASRIAGTQRQDSP
jgi:2-dehydropantoate 2-reductase